ncbi:adenylate isopentenyltransferase 5, chloroplastic-like [Asparagus officinalis]|uniref:adenylate isopentenyltransferase 5, chloroplastic-like n=1 Tax=Asparagus officinalis TaxID=4686 RepID=UPI00098E4D4D|nr:adenylate isopentenyltransferase 5, chloroplastic-like [Asparagus officinalis]
MFFYAHLPSHLISSPPYIPMEILPISASHLIKSQITPFTDKLREGHKFKTCLQQQITSLFRSSPPRIDAPPRRRNKVVFILGSTGTGKSKLAIDLAIHFDGEVVNSDKMQVYAGLDIITNKVTEEECAGVPHHLIGGVHPAADFTAFDFCGEANRAIESIIARGRLPIIAGGSNSYIERLVDDDKGKFRSKYECCFIWIDVDLPVLHSFVSERVDKMVDMGLVEEARTMFDPNGDYSKGIRRSIGVSEMDRYFRAGRSVDGEAKGKILKEAINDIKENTMKLTYNQLRKIRRLSTLPGWEVRKVDATEAFRWRSDPQAERVWTIVARDPSIKIVRKFLDSKLDAVHFQDDRRIEANCCHHHDQCEERA